MKIIVLGGGRVGSAIALDLARDPQLTVTVADQSSESLARLQTGGIAGRRADLAESGEIQQAIADQDLVIGAVPGPMGFATLRTVLEAGKDVVDISFFAEDAFALDALAQEKGVTAVVDCGVAPGAGNIILGYLSTQLERIDSFECYVGGLPTVRIWPYEYKAVFSPIDVIEEYTRPARFRVGGEAVTVPALTDLELLDFSGVGTLEAFNTDGLRTLLTTFDIPDMKEKTLRYPGHVERMRMLRESGFFSQETVRLADGTEVRPLDLTARLLFDDWQLGPAEEDLTVLRVVVDGLREGHRERHTFDLLDHFDRESGITSMARTTGYTCSSVARLVARGTYSRKGISPPEYVGQAEGCFQATMADLAARGIDFERQVEAMD